ncbi:MAG: sulfatase-like hydrolase/transferase, partial [Candidatus Auribacterota bacterium]|nr:sulfatase-like hydrolase/transferase [Candidatus Auribacterota bacterium]
GPRGVIKSTADGKIEDTGPMTRKRMETADDEFLAGSLDFMERTVKSGKPFFVWHNSTRMHVWTRLSEKYQKYIPEYGLYGAGMVELDDHVGILLAKLEELGVADNTIVIFTTDNGAETFTWPDGGMIPFRGYKGTTWEGGFRVPAMVRWPGLIKPGTVINDIFSMEDWVPTLVAAAGEPDIKEKLKKGYDADGKHFKVHLDGYDQTDLLAGKGPGNRREILYFDDTGGLNAIRVDDWKIVFTQMEDWVWTNQKTTGWPKVFNLRRDPFERAILDSPMYFRWWGDKMWTFVPAQVYISKFLETFKEFPPSQMSSSLSIDKVLMSLAAGTMD